jgi:hypothetical protein
MFRPQLQSSSVSERNPPSRGRPPHVIDENVKAAKRRDRRVHHALWSIGSSQVHRHRMHSTAGLGRSNGSENSRAAAATLAPSSNNARVIASPMPLLAPVTTAIFPESPRSTGFPFLLARSGAVLGSPHHPTPAHARHRLPAPTALDRASPRRRTAGVALSGLLQPTPRTCGGWTRAM